MLPKGHTRISISKATESRLKNVRKMMMIEHPEKYDETVSMHSVIIWLLDQNSHHL